MAAQDRVTITVNVDVDDAALDALKAKLKTVEKQTRSFSNNINKLNDRLDSSNKNFERVEKTITRTNDRLGETADRLEDATKNFDDMNSTLDKHDRRMGNVDKRHNKFRRTLTGVVQVFKKFAMTFAKFTVFALVGQLALFTVGLLSVKLALITGRAAISLYDIALKGLSVTAAGVATSLAVAAAAMRQFQEAMLIPTMGGAMNRQGAQNAALLSRSLGSRNAGLLGSEASQSLVASFARAGVGPGRSAAMARQMINLSGGDPAAVQQIANAIASGDLTAATAAVSGSRGFRAGSLSGVSSMSQLMDAIGSGNVVANNFSGVSSGLAGTFVGTAKTEFAGLKNIFADMGQPLLEPFRNAMMDIARIMRQNFISMGALIQRFGAESFAPTLVTMVDKTMDFIRNNIFDHLENITQMGESFVGFFRSIRNFFRGVGDFLGEFEPAANVLIDMFGAMRGTGGGRGLFRNFSDSIVANAEGFRAFGASVGNVIGAVFDLFQAGQYGFFDRLPLFSEILDKLAFSVIPALSNVFAAFQPIMERLPGALEALAAVLNVIAPVISSLVEVVASLLSALSSIPLGGGADLGGAALLVGGAALYSRRGRSLRQANRIRGAAGLPLLGRTGGSSTLALARQQLALRPTYAGGIGPGYARSLMRPTFTPHGYQGTMTPRQLFQNRAMIMDDIAKASGTTRGFSALSKLGKLNVVAGVGLGGYEMYNAATNAYETGRLGIGGALGGGSVGASLGTAILPGVGTVAGALIGAAVGAAVEGIAAYAGNERLKRLGREAAAGISERIAGRNLSGGAGFARVSAAQQELDLFMAAVEAATDPETGEFSFEGDTRAFRDYLRFTGVDPDSVHRDETFKALMENNVMKEMQDDLNEANRFAEGQIRYFADTLELRTDEVGAALERLGLDIHSTIDSVGGAAVIMANVMTLMDRNQTFLPDFSTSAMGQAERRASASAAFTALANASGENLTTDLIADAVESFTAFEVSMGMSPDVAGFSAFREIFQKIISPGVMNADDQARLLEALAAGSTTMVNDMAAAYGMDPGLISQFDLDGDGIIGTTQREVTGLDNFLNERDTMSRALNITSGLSGVERYQALRSMGINIDSPEMREFLRSGMRGGRLYADKSIEEILREQERQGNDPSTLIIRALAEEGLLGEEDVLALQRNNTLAQIQSTGEETVLVLKQIAGNPERGPMPPVLSNSRINLQ